jgi:type II secretory pathway component PulJ
MKRSKFTLIEVLVAGVIMSSVILLVTQAQKQNSLVALKIYNQQKIQEVHFFVKKQIATEIDEKKRSGQGKWEGWSFRWRADEKSSGASRVTKILMGMKPYRIILYKVKLTLKKGEQEYEYEFFKTGFR